MLLCISCAHPHHVRASERVSKPASGWLGGLTVPADHHELVACFSGVYCATAGHGWYHSSVAQFRGPRFQLRLGESRTGHFSLPRNPTHYSGALDQYLTAPRSWNRILLNSAKAGLLQAGVSLWNMVGLDRTTKDPSFWVPLHSGLLVYPGRSVVRWACFS